ncbi:MAG: helix-turn-helix transcriptional regulator [Caldisericia bacterium]|nr:helix-turn-helix transcriptional regulator [Caldisericia bacterium]
MNNDIVDIVAKNIKTLRLQKKLSQEELASLSGLHRTYISLLERKKKNVSIKILQRIADALKVDITSLIK